MSPTPSHRPYQFKANRIFTGREDELALFQAQYAKPQDENEYRVLNYYGIGGQGKTGLCGQFENWLEEQRQNQHLAWAKVDFQDVSKRQPIKALLALRRQLAATGEIRFPAFDTAFAKYFEKAQAGRQLDTVYPELFIQPHDLLQDAADAASEVEGVPGLSWTFKYLYKAKHKRYLKSWMQRRGTELLADIETLNEQQLEVSLAIYLGADIDDWLQDESNQGRRVVLLFDTYEALWQSHPDKSDSLIDKWMRELVAETPAVLHIILGRDALTWVTNDPREWTDDIIQLVPLHRLTKTEAKHFLNAVPITEKSIQERIIQGASGIPFYLHLQVDQYENCKRQGIYPNPEDYGGKEPEILQRFRNHLPTELYKALEIASYPRSINEALFLELSEVFRLNNIRFSELTRYAFWTETNEQYYLHAVMQDYLQSCIKNEDPEQYQKVHQSLFDRYDGALKALESANQITEIHNQALNEGIYHLDQIDRAKIPYWVGKYIGSFHLAAQWSLLEEPLQLSLAITQEIGDKSGEGTTLNNISQIYDARGDYETALDYLKQSLAIRHEIVDKSGEGTTLNNIAGIYRARGDYETALDYLKQSLSITQEIGDKSGEGTTLNNISQIYDARGDYETALDYLKQSLAIRHEIVDKSGEGTTLNNMATIAHVRGDYEIALDYFKQTLVIEQEIGDKLGEGKTLNNISQIYDARGDYEVALDYLKQSLAIRQEIGDKSGEGTTLNNISQIFKARGDYETALDYLKQSLAIQQEIGDIAGLCATLFNIGHIHAQNNEIQDALAAWGKAYGIAKRIELAQILQALEELAEHFNLPDGLNGWAAFDPEQNQEEAPS